MSAPHRNESGIKYDMYISACREHASAERRRSIRVRAEARARRSIDPQRKREREKERETETKRALNAAAHSYDALVRETIARLIFVPGVNRRKCHVRARTSAVHFISSYSHRARAHSPTTAYKLSPGCNNACLASFDRVNSERRRCAGSKLCKRRCRARVLGYLNDLTESRRNSL